MTRIRGIKYQNYADDSRVSNKKAKDQKNRHESFGKDCHAQESIIMTNSDGFFFPFFFLSSFSFLLH